MMEGAKSVRPTWSARHDAAVHDAAAIDAAYRHCWQIATSHYENFTVGSWLLPKPLRRHIAAIYAFARTADDIADEGTLAASERIAALRTWGAALEECATGHATDHPVFIALAHTMAEFALPIDPLRNLLRAFTMDVDFHRFDTFAALCEYCRYSADPVGHLILYLFGYRDPERQRLADQICTGLQLANFWQDVARDAARGRVYIPDEDLERFGCRADDLRRGVATENLRRLMRFEVDRATDLLTNGVDLATHVDRRLAREVRLFAWGGLTILRAIAALDYDVLRQRPTVGKWTKGGLVLQAFWSGVGAPHASPAARRAPT
jgi:squalene synthase HpnC